MHCFYPAKGIDGENLQREEKLAAGLPCPGLLEKEVKRTRSPCSKDQRWVPEQLVSCPATVHQKMSNWQREVIREATGETVR